MQTQPRSHFDSLPEPAALLDAPLNKSSLLRSHLNDCSPCWHCNVASFQKRGREKQRFPGVLSRHCLVLSWAIEAAHLINGNKPLILFDSSTSSRVTKPSVTLNATPPSDPRVALIFSFSFQLGVMSPPQCYVLSILAETEDLWENRGIKAHKYNWFVQTNFAQAFVIKNKVGTNEREIIFFFFHHILLRVAS